MIGEAIYQRFRTLVMMGIKTRDILRGGSILTVMVVKRLFTILQPLIKLDVLIGFAKMIKYKFSIT